MAQNLQHEGATQSANPLLHALRVEDRLERHKEIAGILEDLDEDKAVTLLFDALLKSLNDESRKRVVEELARIGSEKAVELLGSITTDDFDPDVQREALEALRMIGSDRAIDILLSILRGRDEILRWDAARALGDFSSEKVVDALIEFTKGPYLRIDPAIFSLGKIGSDRATEHLITIMHDIYRNDVTSYEATEVLVRLGTTKAIDGLLQAWNDANSIHRMRLHGILHQSKPQRLITPLRQRLQNKKVASDDRRASAEMLGIIGSENDIPFLKSIWTDWGEDSERDVSWAALRAAEQIALSELEKRAERERSLEEMRALIAHGFRHALTPLNAYVKMFEAALAERDIDKEKLFSLTGRIWKQTNAAFDLVNQYMHYSRPLAPEFGEVDVEDLMKEVLEEFKTELENRRILLETQFIRNVSAEVEKKALAEVLRNI